VKFNLSSIILILFISVDCTAQTSTDPYSHVDGTWSVKLNSNDIGTVNTVLEFETTNDSSFKAWTRKGADRDILGFWKSTLARIFTNDFKRGSLIRITDGTITETEDSLLLSGVFRSAMGNYYFNGEIVANQLIAELKDGKQEKKGSISGNKNDNISYPLEDYSSIVSEALDTTKNRIYNRNVLETKEWKSFEKTITEKSAKFQDDVELVFAFFHFASNLPFSHFALTKTDENSSQTALSEKEQYLFLEEKNNNTALLTIKSFAGTATEVDSIFSIIMEKDYKNLIVDLRNNTGGTVEAGMAFTGKVIQTPLAGGFFLTQNWFNEHKSVPNEKQRNELPFFSEANSELILQGIHREKGLILKAKPSASSFNGDLFIITNKRTASTCEPIVHGLKTINRATIIGEKTAGAMLNGEGFELKSGFSLVVPTADYYTTDGFRIDQNGVEPDIVLKDEDPIEYIMKLLIK